MSGQNTRINRQIKEINRKISEHKLNIIKPIIFMDENREISNRETKEMRNQVRVDINRIIGELKTLSLPAANRTEQKKMDYRDVIEN